MLKMTEEGLRDLPKSWECEGDATVYAERLWASNIRSLHKIANAEKADLAAVLAGGKEHTAPRHHVHASDMIALAKGKRP